MKMTEVFTLPKMPPTDEVSFKKNLSRLLKTSKKVLDLRANASIFKNTTTGNLMPGTEYILVKDSAPIGSCFLSEVTTLAKEYYHVDRLYILLEYRHSSASGWFMYGLKELLDKPVIADGAVFADAYNLISKNHKLFRAQQLNKVTGEVAPLTNKINDLDLCYLIDSVKLGCSKQIFFEDMAPTWYPLFDEF